MSNIGSGTDNELLGTMMENKRPSRLRGKAAVPRLILGAVFGWAIWAASPSLTGQVEPWDSISVYYSASLCGRLRAVTVVVSTPCHVRR